MTLLPSGEYLDVRPANIDDKHLHKQFYDKLPHRAGQANPFAKLRVALGVLHRSRGSLGL